MTTTEADIENACRATRPGRVTVILDDDREVAVAIPRGPRRWERLATTIASQAWAEVRLQDARGALLAAPLVRGDAAAPAAAEHDQVDATAAGGALNVAAIVRSTMDTASRAFIEVAKVMRSSGSAEVTAALAANRETANHLQTVIRAQADQIATLQARVAELEAELAARLSDEVEEARREAAEQRQARQEHDAGGGGIVPLLQAFAGGAAAGQAAAGEKPPAKPAAAGGS